MTEKVLYITGCAVGNRPIGFFAYELDTPICTVLFAVGVLLLIVSSYTAVKNQSVKHIGKAETEGPYLR